MKNNFRFLAFLLLLCPIGLFSQNWQPLTVGNKYNYRHADSTLISHVLLIDSMAQLGAGTAYFLNRVVATCDTCSQASVLRNQGQFLQKEMVAMPNGDFWFYGRDSILLRANCQPAATWWFDSLHVVQALCTSTALESVFGQMDSVKTIGLTALTNGSTGEVKLSKHFGILRFENPVGDGAYELLGIEGLGVGEKLPGFFDFYDWEVGDVFQWRYDGFGGSWGEFATIKTTVLEKVQTTDSIHYFVSQGRFIDPVYMDFDSRWYHVALPSIPDSSIFDYYYLLPSPQPAWLSIYPRQLNHVFWYTTVQTPSANSRPTNVRFFNDPVYGPTKMVGDKTVGPSCPVYLYTEGSEAMPCDNDCVFWEQYSVNLGRTWQKISCPSLNFWGEGKLTGFIKNGIATGVITPDWKFTAASEVVYQPEVQVFPNPVSKKCTLHFEQPSAIDLQLEICSLAGNVPIRTIVPANTRAFPLDLSELSPGLYFVRLMGDAQQHNIKLMKLQ